MDERKKTETKTRKMNTFADGSLAVQHSLAKLFTFRWQFTNTESVEKKLAELTGNLDEDKENSQIFAHYRYKQDFYIPARLEAFNKMEHHKELMEAMELLKICKVLEGYTVGLLFCINDTHKMKQQRRYDEWKGLIDGLVAKTGNDEGVKGALKPLRDLVDVVYGDKEFKNK